MDQNRHPPAKAHPSKAFFIKTLTRDISLSDCILDLVDNSIHSLITRTKLDVSEHLFAGTKAQKVDALIDISFTPSKFRVKDDCGGISIEDAEEQVFLLGSPVKEKKQAGLDVYGIGMKRAFFKIGRQISILSFTTDEEFKIDINADEWEKKTDEWYFPFTYARKKKSETGGTDIEVSRLNPTVSEQFVSRTFKTILVEKISRAYALFLKAGLDIKVNKGDATADIPELAESKDLRAVRQMIKRDGVDILIMAGLSPVTDKKPRGWYVFCNGRMVLDADKTERTGWGTDSHPGFHAKYNHFLGYVYFRSKDVQKLPWTTTKEGVDRESPIYQAALAEMRLLSRPVLNFLSDLYSDVKEQSEPEHTLFKEAKPVEPDKIANRENTIFKARVKKESEDDLVSIQYKRPKKKLKKIKEVLSKPGMSASRIGEYTFDWFYDRNCK
jgi:hypothetical protein